MAEKKETKKRRVFKKKVDCVTTKLFDDLFPELRKDMFKNGNNVLLDFFTKENCKKIAEDEGLFAHYCMDIMKWSTLLNAETMIDGEKSDK